MIWLIVIIVIVWIIVSFSRDLHADKKILSETSLPQRLASLIEILNDEVYNGLGTVTIVDKRVFSLYKKGENQIIEFMYSTDILTITWRFKWFQNEIVHNKKIRHAHLIDSSAQMRIAHILLAEMEEVITQHKSKVENRMFNS